MKTITTKFYNVKQFSRFFSHFIHSFLRGGIVRVIRAVYLCAVAVASKEIDFPK